MNHHHLVAEMKADYPTYNGWTFEYVYDGYFSYFKKEMVVFFTPDFITKGQINCQIMDKGQHVGGHDVSYSEPLTAHYLFKTAQAMIDKIDAQILGID